MIARIGSFKDAGSVNDAGWGISYNNYTKLFTTMKLFQNFCVYKESMDLRLSIFIRLLLTFPFYSNKVYLIAFWR